jgi:hypothetical protein
MPDRRETLKIIGAIGTTCAFPFASDELYGQHAHPAGGAQSGYGEPLFFTKEEMGAIARITDLIIPETDTPGAAGAGVPGYIDYVVSSNAEWKSLFREGLAELRGLDVAGLLAVMEKYIDRPGEDRPTRFWRAMKGMTADGYYTSKVGLADELGYKGNSVRESYPSCEVPEH